MTFLDGISSSEIPFRDYGSWADLVDMGNARVFKFDQSGPDLERLVDALGRVGQPSAGWTSEHTHFVLDPKQTKGHIALGRDGRTVDLLNAITSGADKVTVGLWRHHIDPLLAGVVLAADVVITLGSSALYVGPNLLPGVEPVITRRVGATYSSALLHHHAQVCPLDLHRMGLVDVVLDDFADFETWVAKAKRRGIGELGTYRARRRVHAIDRGAIAKDFLDRKLQD